MWKIDKLTHQRNISSNQPFSNLFSKTVTFTKFLPKMRERIPIISAVWHCDCVIIWNIFPIWSFSWNHFTKELNSLVLKLVWRKLQKQACHMYILFASKYQIEFLIIDWYFIYITCCVFCRVLFVLLPNKDFTEKSRFRSKIDLGRVGLVYGRSRSVRSKKIDRLRTLAETIT